MNGVRRRVLGRLSLCWSVVGCLATGGYALQRVLSPGTGGPGGLVIFAGGLSIAFAAGLAVAARAFASGDEPDRDAWAPTGTVDATPPWVSALARDLGRDVVRAEAALEEVRGRLGGEGEDVAAALRAIDGVRGGSEGMGQALAGISGATSDNSTSLVELSASVDEVATNADALAQQVSSTASSVFQMVHSIQEVTGRVEVLARETDTTATSMAQIDESTRHIESNARDAAELSGRMAEAGREGSRAVKETLHGIHAAYGVIQGTARAMEELSQASEAVDGVVKIINEINDKTKLLSLNAAIIAAQAGEHGKSFGVVAHEIQNLSERTAVSTGEISRIIRSIRERVEAATEAVARGEGSTARSVELAERAGKTLEHILTTASLSHEMTRDILKATEEQSRGSQSVMASMQEVNAMVAYIRQAAQEHRANGEAVSESAEIMRSLTEQVKLATAEQANVSRYISEAISAVDRNLQELLQKAERGREGAETAAGLVARLRDQHGDRVAEVDELGVSLDAVDRRARELSELAGGEDGDGGLS